jgi:signal peptidase
LVLNVFLVALVALAAAVAIVPRVTGAVPLTVLSGSMQPTFRPGDLVIVRPTASENLEIGDIVTFQPHSGVATLITHRIIDITADEHGSIENIITQGDANNAPDQPLRPEQIMGRVWYSVPLVGHITNGRNALIAISAVGLALVSYAVVLFVKKDDADHPEGGATELGNQS